MAKETRKERKLVFHPRNWRYQAMTGGKSLKNSWLDLEAIKQRYALVAGIIGLIVLVAGMAYWGWQTNRFEQDARINVIIDRGLYFPDMRGLMATQRKTWRPATATAGAEQPQEEEGNARRVLEESLWALRERCIVRFAEDNGGMTMLALMEWNAERVANLIEVKERSRTTRAAILKELAREARRKKDPHYAWCLLGVIGTGGSGQIAERREAVKVYVDCYLAFAKLPTVTGEVAKILVQYPLSGRAEDVVKEALRIAEEKGAAAGTEYLLGKMKQ